MYKSMEVLFPKKVNFVSMIVKLSVLLFIGYVVDYITENILIGVFSFLVLLIVYPTVRRLRVNSEFSKNLRRFGMEFTGEYSQEIYESSIMGFVPYNNQYVSCFVFADEEGLLIGKMGKRRRIPWQSVAGYKSLNYLGHAVLELNINNFEQQNRLVIPWDTKFKKYIPRGL